MSQANPVLDRETIKKLQGVIQQHVQQFQSDPESARTEFSAQAKLVKGFETRASAREFDLTIDEPEELGGTNKGPNPVEVLLGALGTCQEIVIAAYAAALDIELESVEIDVRGDLDLRGLFAVGEVQAGFQSINFDANILAKNATAEQLEQLKSLALAHCPVLDTLQRPITVTSNYTLASAEAPAIA